MDIIVLVLRRLLFGLIVSFAICASVNAQNPDGTYDW